MRFGPPGRDQPIQILALVSIDDRDFDVVSQANGVDAYLTIVEPVVNALQRRTIENLSGVGEANFGPVCIDPVLREIPCDTKELLCHNVLTIPGGCKDHLRSDALTIS
jgi:hypothetical protein